MHKTVSRPILNVVCCEVKFVKVARVAEIKIMKHKIGKVAKPKNKM